MFHKVINFMSKYVIYFIVSALLLSLYAWLDGNELKDIISKSVIFFLGAGALLICTRIWDNYHKRHFIILKVDGKNHTFHFEIGSTYEILEKWRDKQGNVTNSPERYGIEGNIILNKESLNILKKVQDYYIHRQEDENQRQIFISGMVKAYTNYGSYQERIFSVIIVSQRVEEIVIPKGKSKEYISFILRK